MNIFRNNNTLLFGLMIGLTIPVLGYVAVEGLFEILTNAGYMDEVTEASSLKRKRTLSLIAMCFNILSVQFFKKRYFNKILNGIVTATLIYALIWLVVFKLM